MSHQRDTGLPRARRLFHGLLAAPRAVVGLCAQPRATRGQQAKQISCQAPNEAKYETPSSSALSASRAVLAVLPALGDAGALASPCSVIEQLCLAGDASHTEASKLMPPVLGRSGCVSLGPSQRKPRQHLFTLCRVKSTHQSDDFHAIRSMEVPRLHPCIIADHAWICAQKRAGFIPHMCPGSLDAVSTPPKRAWNLSTQNSKSAKLMSSAIR